MMALAEDKGDSLHARNGGDSGGQHANRQPSFCASSGSPTLDREKEVVDELHDPRIVKNGAEMMSHGHDSSHDEESVGSSTYTPKSYSTADYRGNSGKNEGDSNHRANQPSSSAIGDGQAASWYKCSKAMVFLVLVVAAASSAFAVYTISRQEETNVYKLRFKDIANTIKIVSEKNAIGDVQAYETASQHITSYTSSPLYNAKTYTFGSLSTADPVTNKTTWPFIHLPDFEAQTEQIQNFTQTRYVGLTPVVTAGQRSLYQVWASKDRDWVQESLDHIGMPNHTVQGIPFVFTVNRTAPADSLTRYIPSPVNNEYGFSLPVSQISPVVTYGGFVNFDAAVDPLMNATAMHVYRNGVTTLTPPRYLSPTDTRPGAAQSYMATPVMKTVNGHEEEGSSSVVAILTGNLMWDGFFTNVVPEGVDGIYLVIRNECTLDYTYRIDGPDVLFIGEGDFHDTALDDSLTVQYKFTAFATVPSCAYQLQLYPTQDFYDAYHTKQPFLNMLTVIVTFLATALVFIMYDVLVERRQNRVMKTATRSNAILSSLFPDNVRERLMNDAEHGPNHGSADETTGERNKLSHNGPHGALFPNKRNVNIRKVFGGRFWQSSPHMSSNEARCGMGATATPNGNGSNRQRRASALVMGADLGGFVDGDHEAQMVDTMHQPSSTQIYKMKTKPIADLFPHATVLFADLAGFTAWSSTRAPTQVFELLETLYNSFDIIARRFGVFKVETIGDCYVAATGLPSPNPDHATIMVRFAKTCLARMQGIMSYLAVSLGPSTRSLGMRFGIHSGAVTAGVLRGEKSRFQLFGDTVNTAARIESTGMINRIHISQETADCLITSGKSAWLLSRRDKVVAKGKGELQTYWIKTPSNIRKADHETLSLSSIQSFHDTATQDGDTSSSGSLLSSQEGRRDMVNVTDDHDVPKAGLVAPTHQSGEGNSGANNTQAISSTSRHFDTDTEFEIQWVIDVIQNLLKEIIAVRHPSTLDGSIVTNVPGSKQLWKHKHKQHNANVKNLKINSAEYGKTVLDEVQEVIQLPNQVTKTFQDPESISLSPTVQGEIQDYVQTIAAMYRKNPFHSFSHATHVVQSTVKLMSRIVRSEDIDFSDMTYKKKSGESLHQYTYGITSDPLTQFACIMAALVHDVDHTGVPNAQLIKEDSPLAQHYKNKSVAEQNSLDLSWDLLMEPRYENLRSCIYHTQDELDRFRQLLVNAVMATDIMDKELGALRRNRWDKAFNKQEGSRARNDDSTNRMATIVIEHLIQASDVAHTMQHWHVYRKWNERLFDEMYLAYKAGRSETDPTDSWYDGELAFFDFYVIPLAMKLKECGVFGVSSDEYLQYAQANRKEWESRGRDLLQGYRSKFD